VGHVAPGTLTWQVEEMGSRLDQVYRSILLTRFYTRGWGRPDTLSRIIKLRKVLGDRATAQPLLQTPASVVQLGRREAGQAGHTLLSGSFPSPATNHLPLDIFPPETRTAHFQAVLPAQPAPERPLVVQFAGTGDHFYWRRRKLMAEPLAEEGVASIILENPFYGVRRPRSQAGCNIVHVS